MPEPMHNRCNAVTARETTAAASGRQTSIFRSVFLLTIATVVLVVFIAVLGDVRRKRAALERARDHAAILEMRYRRIGALPLDLKPELAPDRLGGNAGIEWLFPEEARVLRGCGERLMVARTRAIPRVLSPDGRAVVFFQDGRFDVEWLTLAEFDRLQVFQRELVRRRGTDAAADARDEP